MIIGVCTLHYSRNYGAMLQGYALKTYLEKQGDRVIMTDQRRGAVTKWSPRAIKKPYLKNILLYPKYLYKWYLPEYFTKRRREKHFDAFLKKYLKNGSYDEKLKLDAIIYGSDQIWSKFPDGYDEIFWGMKNSNTDRRIAFAASMGVVRIANERDENFVREALSRFSAISVREKDLQEELVKRGLAPHVEVEIMLDPTFLIEKDEWAALNPKRIVQESYLLFYDFQLDKKTTEIASYIAKKKGLRMIRLTDGVVSVEKNKDYFVSAGPLEFLSLYYYADFVVSSSFHGTAFSIIFGKQFYVRQIWNTERVRTLLNTFDLDNRFVDDVMDVDLDDEINYQKVDLIIQQKREEGAMFLNEALGK